MANLCGLDIKQVYSLSIVDTVGVVTFLAFVEHSRSLVYTSRLDHVIFHLRVVALRASLTNDHLALSSSLSHASSHFVLMQPLFVLSDLQFSLDDLAYIDAVVPANSLKLSWVEQIWQRIVSLMVQSSIRPPQIGQKSLWNPSQSIVDLQQQSENWFDRVEASNCINITKEMSKSEQRDQTQMEQQQPQNSQMIEEQCRSLMHYAKEYIKQKKQFKAVRSLKEIYKYKLEAYEKEVCELLVSCYEELEDQENVIIWLEKLDEFYEKEGDQILRRIKICQEQIEKQKQEAMTQQERKERKQKQQLEEKKKKTDTYQKYTKNLQKQLEKDPQSVEILQKLALIYESNESVENYEKATKMFTKLIQLQPNNLKYHQKLAFHLAQSRKGKDAINALNKAEAIDENWKETLSLQRGEIYLRMGKYNEALKNLKEVIDINKKCQAAFYAIGKSYKQNGQYEQAIKAFLECIQLNPKHNFAHSFLAECYFLNKQYFKYEQRLNFLKKLQSSQHFVRFLQGKILQYSLDYQKSNECLIKLLDTKLFTELKVEVYRAVAYNYQALNYLPTANLWYYKALFFNRESVLLKLQIELNWLHIQLIVKPADIKYTDLQSLMQFYDFKSHYMLYIRQLQICHTQKKYQRVDAVYDTISSQLNLFQLEEEIAAKVLLIVAFKEKGNLDVCMQMYHEAYQLITEVFTPNTINVLHFEFKTLIQLSLDFKIHTNAVNLLARIDEFIKELKEEGYHLKANIIEDYIQDARIKVEKYVP